MSIQELTDEISVLSAFIRDIDEKDDLVTPIKEVIMIPLIKRIKFLTKQLEKY